MKDGSPVAAVWTRRENYNETCSCRDSLGLSPNLACNKQAWTKRWRFSLPEISIATLQDITATFSSTLAHKISICKFTQMKSSWFKLSKKEIHSNILQGSVPDGNFRTILEICSKLTIKTAERRHWRHPGIFIVRFEQISRNDLVFPLLVLNK